MILRRNHMKSATAPIPQPQLHHATHKHLHKHARFHFDCTSHIVYCHSTVGICTYIFQTSTYVHTCIWAVSRQTVTAGISLLYCTLPQQHYQCTITCYTIHKQLTCSSDVENQFRYVINSKYSLKFPSAIFYNDLEVGTLHCMEIS